MRAPFARYVDLWLDAYDVDAVAAFWAGALHLRRGDPGPDGAVPLWDTERDRVVLWIRPCGPGEVRDCRVHVDVGADEVGEFLTLGARLVDSATYPWVVLEGPEKAELCVFPREPGERYRVYDVVIETPDPHATAAWWADVLGTQYRSVPDDGYATVEPIPGAPFATLVLTRLDVPSVDVRRLRPRIGTWDPGALFAAGAIRSSRGSKGDAVMLDPDGNEFFVTRIAPPVVRGDDE